MSKTFGIERRALIAFVASMALFLLYDSLYLAPKMREQRQQREAAALTQQQELARLEKAKQETASSDTLGGNNLSPSLVPSAAGDSLYTALTPVDTTADVASKSIVVSSPLYEITIDARGAAITSVHLLRFATKHGTVELLPAGDSWSGDRMLSATVRGAARELAVEKVVFEALASGGQPLPDGARVVVSGTDSVDVVFRAAGSGGVLERTYRFYGDRYDFRAALRVSESLIPGAETVAWSFGPGLAATEENVKDDQSKFRAAVLLGEEFHRKRPADFGRANVEQFSGTLNWASLQTKYFLAAIIPPQPMRAEVEMSGIKQESRISEKVAIPAVNGRGEVTSDIRVFFGPLDFKLVKSLGVGLEKDVEFGMKFIRPVSVGVLWAMNAVHRVIPNYGWVIVIISVATKLLFYRLTHKSFTSMKEMQDLQPRLAALKEKFGSDRRRLSEETMKLYKEAGVNPLGGCLPMLLQMPVFIALFNVLSHAVELRGAPWIAWIHDLSQQDILFKLPATLPLIGDNFSLLPLLMGAAMWMQSKLGGSPTGQPGNPMPPGFNTILPIVFTFLFYKMPSGLVIYWIINTGMSVMQQYYIAKAAKPALAVVAEEPAPTGKKRRTRKSS